MNGLYTYLVQSSVTLMILFLLYLVFLRRDTFFKINRFYLLFTLLMSLLLPLIDFRLEAAGPVTGMIVLLGQVTVTPGNYEHVAPSGPPWLEIAGMIYLAGVAVLTVHLLARLGRLWLIVLRNKIIRADGMNIVLVGKEYSPFSFFNMIFVSRDYFDNENMTAVLAHEKVHIRQFHTIDLLLVEMITIIQWFNPFAWLLGRSARKIHEFLADEGVLEQGFRKDEYTTLILAEANGIRVNDLTNNFNVSLIKNRIQMMTKARSGAWAVSKVLITLPAILFLILLYSAGSSTIATAQVQEAKPSGTKPQEAKLSKTNPGVYTVVEQMPTYPGGDQARTEFMMKNIKYPEEALKKGVQGKVFVSFIVEADGSISNVKALKGVGSGCEEEAVRVISMMPKWNPGKHDGKAVRTEFVMPINFALDNKEKPKEEKK